MKNKIIIITSLTLLLVSCNSNKSDKEKELNSRSSKQDEIVIVDSNKNNDDENIEKQEKKEVIKMEYLIKEHSVGKFKIGYSIPSPTISDNYVLEKKKETTMTEEGPYEETLYNVVENGTTTIKISPADNTINNISEIIVLSKNYKTDKEIGINSSLKEFVKSYPKHKIFYTYVSDMCFIQSENSDIQYIIDKNGLKNDPNLDSELVSLKLSDFDSSTKIIKIRVYN